MYQPHTVRDGVSFSTTPAAIRKPAFRVIDRMQASKPHEQIVGTAVALLAMAEAIGLNAHELIDRASRMMSAVDGPFTGQIRAIRDYAKHEIGREVSL